MGATASHIDCPNTFNKFLNFNKSTNKSGQPLPQLCTFVGKKEEKTQETQTFPNQPSHKDGLMVSSVPDAVVSPSDIDYRIVKAVDEL